MIIDTNATWRFRKGTGEASLPDTNAWRLASFADTNFNSAPAPFWYGDALPGATQISDMQSNYTCIFLRKTFVVSNLMEIGGLQLGAAVDDGFIAWINGTEVQRVNMPDPPGTPVAYTNLSSGAPSEPPPFVIYTLATPPAYLVPGTNVLAVRVFNVTTGSSDLGFNCSLSSVLPDTNPPTIVAVSPAPGSLVSNLIQVTVTFSEAVTGVTADALLVNRNPASSVTGSNNLYTFTFSQPDFGLVSFTWLTNHTILDLAQPPNRFNELLPGASWSCTRPETVLPTVVDLFPGVRVTAQALGAIEVAFSEPVSGVDASDLRINGQPASNVVAQPVNRYVVQFAQPSPGPVNVSWAGGHGITDIVVPANAFAGSAWTLTLDPNSGTGTLVLTEIAAANQHGLEEEDLDPATGLGEPHD